MPSAAAFCSVVTAVVAMRWVGDSVQFVFHRPVGCRILMVRKGKAKYFFINTVTGAIPGGGLEMITACKMFF